MPGPRRPTSGSSPSVPAKYASQSAAVIPRTSKAVVIILVGWAGLAGVGKVHQGAGAATGTATIPPHVSGWPPPPAMTIPPTLFAAPHPYPTQKPGIRAD